MILKAAHTKILYYKLWHRAMELSGDGDCSRTSNRVTLMTKEDYIKITAGSPQAEEELMRNN